MWQPRHRMTYAVSLFCLSLLPWQRAPFAFAVAPPPSGTVVSRCEDPASTTSSENAQDAACTSRWSQELQQQHRVDDGAEPTWESFQWGPYPMSEFELSLLYRPGERRPLWGY
jgi:hypothetical protein